MKTYYVYILNNTGGMLYTGVTNNLYRRMYEHKYKLQDSYTKKYQISRLIYYKQTTDINAALVREKEIKGWIRKKKIELIKTLNPTFQDLAEDWFDDE